MRPVVIVGWVASPRKGMNTDSLVSIALEGAQETGAEIRKLYLNDLQVKPCQACASPPTDAICLYQDGMEEIYGLMETVDGIIVGSPAYYGSISSQLKLVVGGVNCLQQMIRYSDGRVSFRTKVKRRKKGMFFWIADSSRDVGPALAEIRPMFGDMNIELVDTFVVTDAERGQGARRDPERLQRAFELGQMLAARLRGK